MNWLEVVSLDIARNITKKFKVILKQKTDFDNRAILLQVVGNVTEDT
ncbi:hypothetical protein [Enterococcus faecalis]